ncbi:hypothetical protein G6L37_04990 [Agrobacterium rubi]|nr:hypothetical protein [Agrobacterium rubi]NTF24711.1 hypothetical protein [Agrobacterium rubi]
MTSASFRRVRGDISVLEISGFGYDSKWRIRSSCCSIDDFAQRLGYHRYFVVSPQGRIVETSTPINCDTWRDGLYSSFEVYDTDGVLIPAYIVLEDVAAYRRESDAERVAFIWKKRGWPRPPETYFRNGPLPGSHRRLRRPKDYKRSGTFAEVRERAGDEADMDDLAVQTRLRAKRSRSMIGDNDWEGVWSMRSKDRSWKRHRRTQWRQ